jgi:hypothetical protein
MIMSRPIRAVADGPLTALGDLDDFPHYFGLAPVRKLFGVK